jgi:hypothetical protein
MANKKMKRGRPVMGTSRKAVLCVSVADYVAEHIRDYAHEQKKPVSQVVEEALLQFVDTNLQR